MYHLAPTNTQSFNRYSYVLNNPLKYVDPSGWNTEQFYGEQGVFDWVMDAEGNIKWDENAISPETTKDGETYIGETYLKILDNGTTEYGAQDGKKYDSYPLDEVSIVYSKEYQQYKMEQNAKYGPWMGPDAVSVQLNGSASGIFMESGFSVGIAMSGSEFGVFGGANAGGGLSLPGFGLSLQVNFHEKADNTTTNSLNNLNGLDMGGCVGLGLIGGYSTSIKMSEGRIARSSGFDTYSLGMGLGGGMPLGARTSISTTIYKPLIKK